MAWPLGDEEKLPRMPEFDILEQYFSLDQGPEELGHRLDLIIKELEKGDLWDGVGIASLDIGISDEGINCFLNAWTGTGPTLSLFPDMPPGKVQQAFYHGSLVALKAAKVALLPLKFQLHVRGDVPSTFFEVSHTVTSDSVLITITTPRTRTRPPGA